MTQQLYDDLWHYTEQFTRDPLQRSELITMAWKEGERLGERASPNLMKSMMHFRAKELDVRSAFPVHEVGKSVRDAWHADPISLEKPIHSNGNRSFIDTLCSVKTTPFDHAVVSDFLRALTPREQMAIDDLSAGYTAKEILARRRLNGSDLARLKRSLRRKAMEYLV